MKFSELYKKGIDLWPDEISIGDGYPTGKTGYFFQELSLLHNEIEERLSADDGWSLIIVWSMFQSFHSESKRLISEKIKTLQPRLVNKSEIEWRVKENLSAEGWESLKEEYENDL